MKPEKQTKIHPCSLEHYDRYRLKSPSGHIVAVGSNEDMTRLHFGNPPVYGTVEFFAHATK